MFSRIWASESRPRPYAMDVKRQAIQWVDAGDEEEGEEEGGIKSAVPARAARWFLGIWDLGLQ